MTWGPDSAARSACHSYGTVPSTVAPTAGRHLSANSTKDGLRPQQKAKGRQRDEDEAPFQYYLSASSAYEYSAAAAPRGRQGTVSKINRCYGTPEML